MKLNIKDPEFSEHIRLTLLAVLVGLVAGFASILFKLMIQFFQNLFWRAESIISVVATQPWYLTILIPAAGALLISPLIYYGAREAKGHGVPEIMESLVFRGGRIRTKVVAIKALASSICIASGGSVGREGPIVQISSTIASSIGRLFRIQEKGLRTLVAAGAAAGIGATFNAPIAGALFAVEVLLGEFGIYSFSPIIVASVISTLTSRLVTGDFAAFTVPKYTLISVWEIGPYVLLGIVSGLVAILFIKVLYFFEDKFDDLRIHPLIKPILGGILIGVIGLKFSHIFGVGYESINACLTNNLGYLLALVLVFAKILSTSLTLGSGGSGGIFAPSLFLGAMTGNFIGSLFHQAFPSSISSPGAFSLVGMGAVVAAATHAPITAIIIIFELTNDYKIILPLMLSCIIASFMTVGVHKESIYTMKLKRRGIIFSEGREVNILKSFAVKDFISHDYQLFINTERVGKIIDQAIGSKHHSFQIVDAENNHIGCFALNQLKNLLEEKDIVDSFVIAQDLAVTDIKLDYEDNLEKAMKIFGRTDVAEIAVLQNRKFAGVVKRKDVIEAYNHEIIKREAAAGLVQKMKFTTDMQSFDFGTGYKLMEIDAPLAFWNKSLKELDLKAFHRIDVLLIKRKYPPQTITIPSGDEVIRKGDRLIIAGPEENIPEIISGKRE
ncbi:MAG: chloride channel protein [Candidatus Aminicenantaceae bacterium]